MKKQRGDRHQNVCSYPALENNDLMLCVCECLARTQTGEDNERRGENEGGKDRESKINTIMPVHWLLSHCYKTKQVLDWALI